MKESKIILLESSVKGNKEPFPSKTTHSPCCSFPASESVIISHVIRCDQLLCSLGNSCKNLTENKLKAKVFGKLEERFQKYVCVLVLLFLAVLML